MPQTQLPAAVDAHIYFALAHTKQFQSSQTKKIAVSGDAFSVS
jgi:hypothetical protein